MAIRNEEDDSQSAGAWPDNIEKYESRCISARKSLSRKPRNLGGTRRSRESRRSPCVPCAGGEPKTRHFDAGNALLSSFTLLFIFPPSSRSSPRARLVPFDCCTTRCVTRWVAWICPATRACPCRLALNPPSKASQLHQLLLRNLNQLDMR